MVEFSKLSRRERQIMDILYRLGRANAKEVMEKLPDAPTYSTVRTILQKLLEKGHISEQGSQEDLIKLDGHYATLFHLQAKGYH